MNRRNNSAGRTVIAGLIVNGFVIKHALWTLVALAIGVGLVTSVAAIRRIRATRWGMSSGLRTAVIPRRSTIASMNNQSPAPVSPRQKMFRTSAAFGAIAVTLGLVSALDDPERIATPQIERHAIQLESLASEINAATITTAAAAAAAGTAEADVSTIAASTASNKLGDVGRRMVGILLAPVYVPVLVFLMTAYINGTANNSANVFWQKLIVDTFKSTLGRIFPRLAEKVTAPTAAAVTASQKHRPRSARGAEGDKLPNRHYRSAAMDSAKRGAIAKVTPKRKSVGSVGHRGQRGGHAAAK